ncbi:hypothetical protein TRFO_37497 [Tritrichomonas foetus]|uniref:Uncharacterized protein n=1 Tax=Tritrichomonas foetus TaxID=1144522 RepID=A0A1J4JB21_9EUKA|nr:hypothetical protein TRFO_37497 [Tritrichomonas foetus]|eukprot:OHS96386.1 hypothetical protein TRFO_37497 [Tritrichomonas foetus]
MSAKVSLNLGEENDIELTLDYKIKNGDINLSFHDDEGEDYITDKLSQFTSIDVDDNNPLKLILRGIKVDRPILFQKENEASDFWTAIQKIAKLSALPGPKRSFVITMEPQQPGIGDYVPLVNFLNRTITSTYQTVKNIVGGKELELPKQEEIIETDGFKLGYIQGSISDLRIVDFDENIEISKNHQISNTNFNEVQIFKIWQKLLLPNNSNTDKLLEDYKNIELQWKTLSKGQWNHSFQLRNFVVQTEKSIKESPVLSKDPFDSITFDLLLSRMFL